MPTTPIIAGNWKMNTNVQEARKLVAEMKSSLESIDGTQKVVCPPFVALTAVAELLRGSSIALGAQNMYHQAWGAYTGEVSGPMLADLCRFVILGHSERRQLFAEGDDLVNLKVRAALDVGLRPILCVGERLEEREGGQAEETVERQLRACLQGVESVEGIVVAYEPVWAIGTGRAATPEVAQDMMARIRAVLASLYGDKSAANVALLYGGSVGPDNIASFMRGKDVNGALVGGASLKAASFIDIVRKAARAEG